MSASRLAYSLAGAAEATGLSKSYLDREIRAGRLRAKRSSTTEDGTPTGSFVIPARELERFIDALVDA